MLIALVVAAARICQINLHLCRRVSHRHVHRRLVLLLREQRDVLSETDCTAAPPTTRNIAIATISSISENPERASESDARLRLRIA